MTQGSPLEETRFNMRHSMVIHPLLEGIGGSETVCLAFLKALWRNEHEVELLSSRISKPLLDAHWADVFEHVTLTRMRALHPRPFDTYLRYLLMWGEIRRHTGTRPDYVFLTQELLPGVSRFRQSTTVLYVHFPRFRGLEDRGTRVVSRGYLLLISRLLESQLNRIDKIICNSKFTRNAVLDQWSKYGIPEPSVIYPPTLRKFDSSLGWEERKNQVLCVGRFAPFKRHEIMKELAGELPDIAFLSVGSYVRAHDLYTRHLLDRSPPNFTVLFGASLGEMAENYQSSKLYIHLAAEEHFGIAIMEAMSAGCVVLAHNSGGPKEYLPQDLLWTDIEDLKGKVRALLSDRKLWTSWHLRCKEISRDYEFDSFANKLMKTLDQSD